MLDDWMLNVVYFSLVVLVILIWMVLEWKWQYYWQFNIILKIGLCYYLAMIMFSYGILKLFVF